MICYSKNAKAHNQQQQQQQRRFGDVLQSWGKKKVPVKIVSRTPVRSFLKRLYVAATAASTHSDMNNCSVNVWHSKLTVAAVSTVGIMVLLIIIRHSRQQRKSKRSEAAVAAATSASSKLQNKTLPAAAATTTSSSDARAVSLSNNNNNNSDGDDWLIAVPTSSTITTSRAKPQLSIAKPCNQPLSSLSQGHHHSSSINRSLSVMELIGLPDTTTAMIMDDTISHHSSISGTSSNILSFRQVQQHHALHSRSNSLGSCCSCDSFSTLGTQTNDASSPSSCAKYVMIYFATQSGTSAYYASQLFREGQGMGFDIGVRSIKSLADAIKEETTTTTTVAAAAEPPEVAIRRIMIPHQTISGKERGRAVFLVSTYHDGGPTDDAKEFVDILNGLLESKNTTCLKGLRYSVFGFGDSSYGQSYNIQGKLYDRILHELGGKRVVHAGVADAKKDVDYDFESWKWKVFWPKFANLLAKDCRVLSKVDSGEASVETTKKGNNTSSARRNSFLASGGDTGPSSTEFDLEIVETNSIRQCCNGGLGKIHPGSRHLIKGVDCQVKSVTALWRAPDAPVTGSVVHIEFDLMSFNDLGPLKYVTGDNIAVLPVNPATVVDAVARHLDYTLDASFVLVPKRGSTITDFYPKLPTPCTVREYLSLYAELGLPPRRVTIRILSKFATLSNERDELYRLSSKKNYQLYKTKIVNEHIGLGEMITKYYPSIRIPLINFIEMCSALQPRWYSVSSSSLVDPKTLSCTFFVVALPRSVDDSKCYGICSNYMANLREGDAVRIMKMGSSGFVVPQNPRSPLIMISNGTGVAPMRALCQERHYQKTILNADVGPTELFFGVRNRNADFLFKYEFAMYLESESLSGLHLACSQEQEEKVYVQHLFKEQEDHIWEMLDLQGGYIYVCGASTMGSDIEVILRGLVARKLGGTAISVEAYMENLVRAGRYIREGWTLKVDEL